MKKWKRQIEWQSSALADVPGLDELYRDFSTGVGRELREAARDYYVYSVYSLFKVDLVHQQSALSDHLAQIRGGLDTYAFEERDPEEQEWRTVDVNFSPGLDKLNPAELTLVASEVERAANVLDSEFYARIHPQNELELRL